MGLLQRLFGRADEPAASSAAVERLPVEQASREQPWATVDVEIAPGGEPDLVKLSGTTTFAREAITRLAERHRVADRGYLETSGTLQREPDNQADPNAVAVHVEGERIGYLPGYVAARVDLSTTGSRAVAVQIFTELLPKGLRAEA